MVRLLFDHEKKEWLFLTDVDPKSEQEIVMDARRIKYLNRVKKDLRDDKDNLEIICGGVGSGKSTLGRLDCRYVSDERFHPRTHVIRDVNDIKPVITNVQRLDAVLIDEAVMMFLATETMSKKQKYANLIMDVVRQKNLFIVICCPHFHRLTSSIAVDRATTLTRTYIDSRTGLRGRFAFYGTRAKEKLYRFAKANYGSLKGAKPKYRGTFGKDNTHEELYRKVKDETLTMALNSLDGDKDNKTPQTPQEIIYEHNLKFVEKHKDKSAREVGELLDCHMRTIQRMRLVIKERKSQVIT